ncbi:hypothetical protein [Amycolatopsis suaedae]|uniref:Uncharacterized protein n=1 Tax=Amycolatopsis suaedae TaxID=2510978 RepID=A0A4Q7J0H6_9PSEU|nr:hypothetical protein [Amycolatopsis suaedae]RZQ60850.1 hypothetical protein EWH70_27510 [Amycolatopsis suaedae]
MRNARPNRTRRQIEAAADCLDFDALAMTVAEEARPSLAVDELAEVADLLAEIDADLAAHEATECATGAPETTAVTTLEPGRLPIGQAPAIGLRLVLREVA